MCLLSVCRRIALNPLLGTVEWCYTIAGRYLRVVNERQDGDAWPARSGGWLGTTIRYVVKCVYNRRARVRRQSECWSAVVKAASISNNQCMYARGQHNIPSCDVAEDRTAGAMMECLSSSGMSPDCSSSGSESSLTASAPSTPGSSPDYLSQLLKDRKQMQAFSNVFIHLDRILEDGELFELSDN